MNRVGGVPRSDPRRCRLPSAVAAGLLALMVTGAAAQAPAAGQTPRMSPFDLRNVLAPGWLLEDRNGDDVLDFVRGRIILPVAAGAGDLVVAANLAARLGYETSAADLDVAAGDAGAPNGFDVPVVLIGNDNGVLARASAVPGPAAASAQRGALAPGEGEIAFIRPNAVVRAGAVAITGGDATGLIAAGNWFASRYPAIWGLRGNTLDSLAARMGRFAAQNGGSADSVTVDRVLIANGRAGVARAQVSIAVADSASFSRLVAALENDSIAAGAAARAPGDTTTAAAQQDTAPRRPRMRRTELVPTDLHRLDVVVRAPGRTRTVRILPERPWATREASAFNAPPAPDFSLAELYEVGGLYRDTNQDLVPDRTDAVLSVHGAEAARTLPQLALRIGLETAGMRFPFAQAGGQADDPQAAAGLPIVYGIGHDQTRRLLDEGRLHASPRPGEGFIEFAPRAFGGRHGLVIGAGDAAGLDAITGYVAGRMPYLHTYGKGNVTLEELQTEVRRFFQVREAPGQIAFALHKLDAWLERERGAAIDSIEIDLDVEEVPEGLEAYIERRVRRRFPGARVHVGTHKTGFGAGQTIFVQDFTLPWEVDAFRAAFTETALPRLTAASRGRIEVRVSESPEVRAQLAEEIRGQLRAAGIAADAFDVRVLSAYKQGYSWLYDAVLPQLRGRGVQSIEIRYHTLADSREVRWQTIESPTRWLQELFPVDAVLARELGIPDSVITFTPTQSADPIYTVIARDARGNELLRETFSPKYVVRPFFDLFPEYERIRVTTGWVTVESDGQIVLNRRIETDPEAFWNVFQTDTYARIIEYMMDVQDGRPSPGNAPYFDELVVDLTLSEPNYRIGIDEEVISSTEALHEDIYFETLTLFDLVGNRYGVGPLSYAGRVLPYVRPPVHGRPGRARITFTGKEHGVPRLVLVTRERGEEPKRQRYDLDPLPVEAPKLRGITVRAGQEGVSELLFDIAAIDSIDRYDEYRERASEEQIDRTALPATTLTGMVATLRDLHAARILEDALSWDRVGRAAFRIVLFDTLSTFRTSAELARSRSPASTVRPPLKDTRWRWNGERIVQWQTPIPPIESDSLLGRLATFPGVHAYRVGESFLGQTVWAADFLPPHEARYISQAKLNALKPTLMLSGRQHANEVSSTSHVLRFGEMLVTDTAWARLLEKVNVVLHPITNPDGARLAVEMQEENPDFMLHAGYLGALGVDMTAGGNTDDPIYPESRVRPELQATWLPDIFMNLHGYPSHEWVQLFAGYAAWVRGRTGTQRTWWAPRGWFVPGFSWVDDARYPGIRTAQFAILDSMAAAITSLPDVEAMNRRMYARYQKYGRQDVENFREYFHNGMLIYMALRGRDATGQGVNRPRITYFSATTEAPDETARGDWLELVATAGLAHTSALLRYLATGVNEITRESNEYEQFVTRSVARKKPVVPPADSVRAGGSR